MADKSAVTLHASGAEIGAGSGIAVDIGTLRTCLRLTLDIVAISGSGFVVKIETSRTGVGWKEIGSFTSSAIGSTSKTFGGCSRFVRASWSFTGTSVTFEVSGYAHVLYCEPGDLSRTGINEVALSGIASDVLADCCLRATDDAESALNSSYELPITAWSEDLRGHVAARAVYYAMSSRGFDPGSEADQLIVMAGGFRTINNAKSGAQEYFDAVRDGRLKPVGIVDQTPDDYEGSGFVISDLPR